MPVHNKAEMLNMKYIRINSKTGMVEDVNQEWDGLNTMYKETDCTHVESLMVRHNLSLIFDGEARLKDKPLKSFHFDNVRIFGNAIAIRNDDQGEVIDTTVEDFAFVLAHVR